MSTLFVNNLNTASGTDITIPTGKKLVVTDTGGLTAPGTVIQVVNSSYSTQTSSSSSSFADTGLTASITPTASSSKVLVIIQVASCFTTTNTNAELDINLLRDSTQLIASMGGRGTNSLTSGDAIGTVGCVFLDSPSSTSSITYKPQFKSSANNATASVQLGNTTSTMTLMEIGG